MQRIQSNDAIHIDGKSMFIEGDAHPEEPRGATTITADFLNTVQEELVSFVESRAGAESS